MLCVNPCSTKEWRFRQFLWARQHNGVSRRTELARERECRNVGKINESKDLHTHCKSERIAPYVIPHRH